MIRDHHKTIGVSENATQQEIKKAYKRKANKMHPDKGGDKNEFQALQEAYAVLSDPSKRKEYEETGEVKRAVNLEMQAYSGIAGIFSEIIDKNRHSIRRIDVVATAIKAVNTGICERHAEIMARCCSLISSRSRIKRVLSSSSSVLLICVTMSGLTFYLANDHTLELKAKETLTGADLSSATVTYTLKPKAGGSPLISGASMSYVAGGPDTNGFYTWRATVPNTTTLDINTDYLADVAFNGGVGRVGGFENVPVKPKYNTGQN